MEQKTENYAYCAMYDYLTTRLKELQDEKKKEPKVPNMVTKGELFDTIMQDAKNVLNTLWSEKKVKVHKTIHSPIHDFVELVEE